MAIWTEVSTLPYSFWRGSAVVLDREIHILGSYSSVNYTKHYKYSNGSWTEVSTLPYNFYDGSAVVLDNEIHILGTYVSDNRTKHYKYSNGSWTEVSTLPYVFYQSSAVVLDSEIHILGSGNSNNYTKHYKYSNGSWTEVSTLPYNFERGSAVVLGGEIHILGSYNGDYTKHYKYSNGSWTEVSTLPYNFYLGSAVVLYGEINILGSGSETTKHYKYSNESWTEVSTLPYIFYRGSSVILDGEIHILGSGNSSNYTKHYKFGSPINKVVYGDRTLIDLTSDTITEDKLVMGCTAHDCSGNSITGTRPKYYQRNSSTLATFKNVDYDSLTSYLYKSVEGGDVAVFKLFGERQIYLRNSGTNMMLVVDTGSGTESTITIGTVGASYKSDFYIKDVLFIDRCRCIIHYYSKNGNGTYTAQSIRLITIKHDGTLAQSNALTLANATTASLECYGRVTRMLDSSDSFMLIQYRYTISSGAMIIYASRAQANFTTGALSMPSSSAWVTVAANNAGTAMLLKYVKYGGGFFYVDGASNTPYIFIWHGYSSGYKKVNVSSSGLELSTSMSDYMKNSIIGRDSNNNIIIAYFRTRGGIRSYYYDPVNCHFTLNTILYSGYNIDPRDYYMVGNGIIIKWSSTGEVYQATPDDTWLDLFSGVSCSRVLDAYHSEATTGPNSDLFNGYYLYGD